ncbi:MAG: hypothetical protein JSU72_12510 [Deltaproteobacteria bacterium]|nr:MAG: hypothetical protein JSU72_12510 [Deltaproteobacteria bacterium]
MSAPTDLDHEQLFDKFTQEVAEWEYSPYYLTDAELFDLERFLTDHHAYELKQELESTYGTPLNQRFWSSSLTYQKLRRAREEVKSQDADQEKKRQEYAQAVEQGKKAWQEWVQEVRSSQRRAQLRIIPGGKKTP